MAKTQMARALRVSAGTMPTVLRGSQKTKKVNCNLFASETPGVQALATSGLEDSLMKTKPGMSTRASESVSSTSSRMTATGGCSGKNGSRIITAFTSANFSLQAGVNSLFTVSGKATQPAAHTLCNLTETKSLKRTPRWTRTTSGSTTPSTD